MARKQFPSTVLARRLAVAIAKRCAVLNELLRAIDDMKTLNAARNKEIAQL